MCGFLRPKMSAIPQVQQRDPVADAAAANAQADQTAISEEQARKRRRVVANSALTATALPGVAKTRLGD